MKNITDTALANGIKVTFFVNLYNYACSYDEEFSSQRESRLFTDIRAASSILLSAVIYAYKNGMEICK
jgi:hypothetical protein